MTSSEPQQRKKSKLSDDELWEVSAKPKRPSAKPTATAGTPPASPVGARTRETRGHARDLAEARGRKSARDAAHAWASAARKAADRRAELVAERDAALARSTDPELLATYILEACERHGVDWHLLTGEIQSDIAALPTE